MLHILTQYIPPRALERAGIMISATAALLAFAFIAVIVCTV
jgi:hypothetical protein